MHDAGMLGFHGHGPGVNPHGLANHSRNRQRPWSRGGELGYVRDLMMPVRVRRDGHERRGSVRAPTAAGPAEANHAGRFGRVHVDRMPESDVYIGTVP